MTKLQLFIQNMGEKKTTIMGIVTMAISLLFMLAPKLFVNTSPEELTEIASTGYGLLGSILTFVSGLLLTISRIFPKKD